QNILLKPYITEASTEKDGEAETVKCALILLGFLFPALEP
ncbi:MAG: hypothetical protein RJB31_2098, partial [Bacteroidota bacterium]